MLEAVSVPATLALVHFSSPPRPDLPSLDQFDHMLVYIPRPGGDSFLDCTAKNASLSAPWSLGLAGREALILDAKNPHFVRLPEYPTNASTIRATRSVDLTNQTDALVREKLVFNGAHAGYVREYLRNQLPEGRRSYVASFLSDTIGQLLELTFDGLDQPQLPLAMQFTYLARGQFHVLDGQIVGQPPAGFERAFLIHEAVEKRSSPFEVTTPLTIEGSVTVNLPAGFKPRAPGEPESKTGNAFVNSDAETHAAQHGWQLNYRLFEPAGRFAALEYASYCRAMQQAVETVQPRLVGEPARP